MSMLSLPVVIWQFHHPEQHLPLIQIIAQNSVIFTLLRFGLIGAVYVFWPRFIDWIGKKRCWTPSKTQFWQDQRLYITVWLLINELLIGENIVYVAFQSWGMA